MQLFSTRRCFLIILAALLFPVAARAAMYQVTINPQLVPNFFGPGEPEDNFESNFWDADFTGTLAPPEFSQAVITFTTPDITNMQGIDSPNAQAVIPEINALSNIPLGTNLVPAADWHVRVVYVPGETINPVVDDELDILITDGTQGADQEYDFSLEFAPNSLGQGTALSATLHYFDYLLTPGEPDFMIYNLDSATSVQIVPEPEALGVVAVMWFGLRSRPRRRRN